MMLTGNGIKSVQGCRSDQSGHEAVLQLHIIGAAFAVDQQPAVVSGNVLAGEPGKLGYSQASIKQSPDNEAFPAGLTGRGQAVCRVRGKDFTFVLVGHPVVKSMIFALDFVSGFNP